MVDVTIEQLQQAIEHVSIPTFIVNQEGKIIAWNSAMNEKTGVPFQSVAHKKSWVVFLPRRKKTPADQVLKTGERCREEFVFSVGQEEKEVEFVADPIHIDGELSGVFVQLLSTKSDRASETIEIVKEVEVPVEIVKEVEIIKEVEVPVEIVKEVEVPVEIVKEVEIIKEVEVPVEVVKEVEVIKEVAVPVEIVKEIEIPVEIIKEIEVIKEVEIIKEIEVIKEVEIIKEVAVPVEVARENGDGPCQGVINALNRSQAVIYFLPDGTILDANENFLAVVGYSLEEIQGQHHRMFVDEAYGTSSEYEAFWKRLASGELFSQRFRRVTKKKDYVWIQASYNPIFDEDGQVQKVVKFASDITKEMEVQLEHEAVVSALNRSQAVIYFSPDGMILDANENFLAVVGYSLEEIQGKHHGIFVDEEYRVSSKYTAFWEKLHRGEFVSGRFCRRSKSGEDVWIQAIYNPVFDAQGEVTSVVKFATDITEDVRREAKEAKRKLVEKTTDLAVQTVDELVFLSFQMNKELKVIKKANEEGFYQIQSVAIASEQLSSATQEIAQRSEEADLQSRLAEKKLTDAFTVVQNLSNAAEDVSSIVSLIDEVASQTNLLALNAAIEAARAGEAGRGFGVVASEVKELSRQTRRATQDISNKIATMQEATQQGNDAIGSVVSLMQDINQLLAAISTAMVEQTSVTADLSKNGEYSVEKNTEIVEKTTVLEGGVENLLQKVMGLNKLMVALQDGY